MQELLQKIRLHSDQQAFRQLYLHFFNRLCPFAYSYVRSWEVSEELVNDVFLSFWQKKDGLAPIENANVFFYVAVKNAALNYLRAHNQTLSLHEFHDDHLVVERDPHIHLELRELQHRLQQAIDKLPPRCKMIFKMVKEDGLSYKDVALILDISTKTVDSQLCLALKKLSGLLQPALV